MVSPHRPHSILSVGAPRREQEGIRRFGGGDSASSAESFPSTLFSFVLSRILSWLGVDVSGSDASSLSVAASSSSYFSIETVLLLIVLSVVTVLLIIGVVGAALIVIYFYRGAPPAILMAKLAAGDQMMQQQQQQQQQKPTQSLPPSHPAGVKGGLGSDDDAKDSSSLCETNVLGGSGGTVSSSSPSSLQPPSSSSSSLLAVKSDTIGRPANERRASAEEAGHTSASNSSDAVSSVVASPVAAVSPPPSAEAAAVPRPSSKAAVPSTSDGLATRRSGGDGCASSCIALNASSVTLATTQRGSASQCGMTAAGSTNSFAAAALTLSAAAAGGATGTGTSAMTASSSASPFSASVPSPDFPRNNTSWGSYDGSSVVFIRRSDTMMDVELAGGAIGTVAMTGASSNATSMVAEVGVGVGVGVGGVHVTEGAPPLIVVPAVNRLVSAAATPSPQLRVVSPVASSSMRQDATRGGDGDGPSEDATAAADETEMGSTSLLSDLRPGVMGDAEEGRGRPTNTGSGISCTQQHRQQSGGRRHHHHAIDVGGENLADGGVHRLPIPTPAAAAAGSPTSNNVATNIPQRYPTSPSSMLHHPHNATSTNKGGGSSATITAAGGSINSGTAATTATVASMVSSSMRGQESTMATLTSSSAVASGGCAAVSTASASTFASNEHPTDGRSSAAVVVEGGSPPHPHLPHHSSDENNHHNLPLSSLLSHHNTTNHSQQEQQQQQQPFGSLGSLVVGNGSNGTAVAQMGGAGASGGVSGGRRVRAIIAGGGAGSASSAALCGSGSGGVSASSPPPLRSYTSAAAIHNNTAHTNRSNIHTGAAVVDVPITLAANTTDAETDTRSLNNNTNTDGSSSRGAVEGVITSPTCAFGSSIGNPMQRSSGSSGAAASSSGTSLLQRTATTKSTKNAAASASQMVGTSNSRKPHDGAVGIASPSSSRWDRASTHAMISSSLNAMRQVMRAAAAAAAAAAASANKSNDGDCANSSNLSGRGRPADSKQTRTKATQQQQRKGTRVSCGNAAAVASISSVAASSYNRLSSKAVKLLRPPSLLSTSFAHHRQQPSASAFSSASVRQFLFNNNNNRRSGGNNSNYHYLYPMSGCYVACDVRMVQSASLSTVARRAANSPPQQPPTPAASASAVAGSQGSSFRKHYTFNSNGQSNMDGASGSGIGIRLGTEGNGGGSQLGPAMAPPHRSRGNSPLASPCPQQLFSSSSTRPSSPHPYPAPNALAAAPPFVSWAACYSQFYESFYKIIDAHVRGSVGDDGGEGGVGVSGGRSGGGSSTGKPITRGYLYSCDGDVAIICFPSPYQEPHSQSATVNSGSSNAAAKAMGASGVGQHAPPSPPGAGGGGASANDKGLSAYHEAACEAAVSLSKMASEYMCTYAHVQHRPCSPPPANAPATSSGALLPRRNGSPPLAAPPSVVMGGSRSSLAGPRKSTSPPNASSSSCSGVRGCADTPTTGEPTPRAVVLLERRPFSPTITTGNTIRAFSSSSTANPPPLAPAPNATHSNNNATTFTTFRMSMSIVVVSTVTSSGAAVGPRRPPNSVLRPNAVPPSSSPSSPLLPMMAPSVGFATASAGGGGGVGVGAGEGSSLIGNVLAGIESARLLLPLCRKFKVPILVDLATSEECSYVTVPIDVVNLRGLRRGNNADDSLGGRGGALLLPPCNVSRPTTVFQLMLLQRKMLTLLAEHSSTTAALAEMVRQQQQQQQYDDMLSASQNNNSNNNGTANPNGGGDGSAPSAAAAATISGGGALARASNNTNSGSSKGARRVREGSVVCGGSGSVFMMASSRNTPKTTPFNSVPNTPFRVHTNNPNQGGGGGMGGGGGGEFYNISLSSKFNTPSKPPRGGNAASSHGGARVLQMNGGGGAEEAAILMMGRGVINPSPFCYPNMFSAGGAAFQGRGTPLFANANAAANTAKGRSSTTATTTAAAAASVATAPLAPFPAIRSLSANPTPLHMAGSLSQMYGAGGANSNNSAAATVAHKAVITPSPLAIQQDVAASASSVTEAFSMIRKGLWEAAEAELDRALAAKRNAFYGNGGGNIATIRRLRGICRRAIRMQRGHRKRCDREAAIIVGGGSVADQSLTSAAAAAGVGVGGGGGVASLSPLRHKSGGGSGEGVGALSLGGPLGSSGAHSREHSLRFTTTSSATTEGGFTQRYSLHFGGGGDEKGDDDDADDDGIVLLRKQGDVVRCSSPLYLTSPTTQMPPLAPQQASFPASSSAAPAPPSSTVLGGGGGRPSSAMMNRYNSTLGNSTNLFSNNASYANNNSKASHADLMLHQWSRQHAGWESKYGDADGESEPLAAAVPSSSSPLSPPAPLFVSSSSFVAADLGGVGGGSSMYGASILAFGAAVSAAAAAAASSGGAPSPATGGGLRAGGRITGVISPLSRECLQQDQHAQLRRQPSSSSYSCFTPFFVGGATASTALSSANTNNANANSQNTNATNPLVRSRNRRAISSTPLNNGLSVAVSGSLGRGGGRWGGGGEGGSTGSPSFAESAAGDERHRSLSSAAAHLQQKPSANGFATAFAKPPPLPANTAPTVAAAGGGVGRPVPRNDGGLSFPLVLTAGAGTSQFSTAPAFATIKKIMNQQNQPSQHEYHPDVFISPTKGAGSKTMGSARHFGGGGAIRITLASSSSAHQHQYQQHQQPLGMSGVGGSSSVSVGGALFGTLRDISRSVTPQLMRTTSGGATAAGGGAGGAMHVKVSQNSPVPFVVSPTVAAAAPSVAAATQHVRAATVGAATLPTMVLRGSGGGVLTPTATVTSGAGEAVMEATFDGCDAVVASGFGSPILVASASNAANTEAAMGGSQGRVASGAPSVHPSRRGGSPLPLGVSGAGLLRFPPNITLPEAGGGQDDSTTVLLGSSPSVVGCDAVGGGEFHAASSGRHQVSADRSRSGSQSGSVGRMVPPPLPRGGGGGGGSTSRLMGMASRDRNSAASPLPPLPPTTAQRVGSPIGSLGGSTSSPNFPQFPPPPHLSSLPHQRVTPTNLTATGGVEGPIDSLVGVVTPKGASNSGGLAGQGVASGGANHAGGAASAVGANDRQQQTTDDVAVGMGASVTSWGFSKGEFSRQGSFANGGRLSVLSHDAGAVGARCAVGVGGGTALGSVSPTDRGGILPPPGASAEGGGGLPCAAPHSPQAHRMFHNLSMTPPSSVPLSSYAPTNYAASRGTSVQMPSPQSTSRQGGGGGGYCLMDSGSQFPSHHYYYGSHHYGSHHHHHQPAMGGIGGNNPNINISYMSEQQQSHHHLHHHFATGAAGDGMSSVDLHNQSAIATATVGLSVPSPTIPSTIPPSVVASAASPRGGDGAAPKEQGRDKEKDEKQQLAGSGEDRHTRRDEHSPATTSDEPIASLLHVSSCHDLHAHGGGRGGSGRSSRASNSLSPHHRGSGGGIGGFFTTSHTYHHQQHQQHPGIINTSYSLAETPVFGRVSPQSLSAQQPQSVSELAILTRNGGRHGGGGGGGAMGGCGVAGGTTHNGLWNISTSSVASSHQSRHHYLSGYHGLNRSHFGAMNTSGAQSNASTPPSSSTFRRVARQHSHNHRGVSPPLVAPAPPTTSAFSGAFSQCLHSLTPSQAVSPQQQQQQEGGVDSPQANPHCGGGGSSSNGSPAMVAASAVSGGSVSPSSSGGYPTFSAKDNVNSGSGHPLSSSSPASMFSGGGVGGRGGGVARGGSQESITPKSVVGHGSGYLHQQPPEARAAADAKEGNALSMPPLPPTSVLPSSSSVVLTAVATPVAASAISAASAEKKKMDSTTTTASSDGGGAGVVGGPSTVGGIHLFNSFDTVANFSDRAGHQSLHLGQHQQGRLQGLAAVGRSMGTLPFGSMTMVVGGGVGVSSTLHLQPPTDNSHTQSNKPSDMGGGTSLPPRTVMVVGPAAASSNSNRHQSLALMPHAEGGAGGAGVGVGVEVSGARSFEGGDLPSVSNTLGGGMLVLRAGSDGGGGGGDDTCVGNVPPNFGGSADAWRFHRHEGDDEHDGGREASGTRGFATMGGGLMDATMELQTQTTQVFPSSHPSGGGGGGGGSQSPYEQHITSALDIGIAPSSLPSSPPMPITFAQPSFFSRVAPPSIRVHGQSQHQHPHQQQHLYHQHQQHPNPLYASANAPSLLAFGSPRSSGVCGIAQLPPHPSSSAALAGALTVPSSTSGDGGAGGVLLGSPVSGVHTLGSATPHHQHASAYGGSAAAAMIAGGGMLALFDASTPCSGGTIVASGSARGGGAGGGGGASSSSHHHNSALHTPPIGPHSAPIHLLSQSSPSAGLSGGAGTVAVDAASGGPTLPMHHSSQPPQCWGGAYGGSPRSTTTLSEFAGGAFFGIHSRGAGGSSSIAALTFQNARHPMLLGSHSGSGSGAAAVAILSSPSQQPPPSLPPLVIMQANPSYTNASSTATTAQSSLLPPLAPYIPPPPSAARSRSPFPTTSASLASAAGGGAPPPAMIHLQPSVEAMLLGGVGVGIGLGSPLQAGSRAGSSSREDDKSWGPGQGSTASSPVVGGGGIVAVMGEESVAAIAEGGSSRLLALPPGDTEQFDSAASGEMMTPATAVRSLLPPLSGQCLLLAPPPSPPPLPFQQAPIQQQQQQLPLFENPLRQSSSIRSSSSHHQRHTNNTKNGSGIGIVRRLRIAGSSASLSNVAPPPPQHMATIGGSATSATTPTSTAAVTANLSRSESAQRTQHPFNTISDINGNNNNTNNNSNNIASDADDSSRPLDLPPRPVRMVDGGDVGFPPFAAPSGGPPPSASSVLSLASPLSARAGFLLGGGGLHFVPSSVSMGGGGAIAPIPSLGMLSNDGEEDDVAAAAAVAAGQTGGDGNHQDVAPKMWGSSNSSSSNGSSSVGRMVVGVAAVGNAPPNGARIGGQASDGAVLPPPLSAAATPVSGRHHMNLRHHHNHNHDQSSFANLRPTATPMAPSVPVAAAGGAPAVVPLALPNTTLPCFKEMARSSSSYRPAAGAGGSAVVGIGGGGGIILLPSGGSAVAATQPAATASNTDEGHDLLGALAVIPEREVIHYNCDDGSDDDGDSPRAGLMIEIFNPHADDDDDSSSQSASRSSSEQRSSSSPPAFSGGMEGVGGDGGAQVTLSLDASREEASDAPDAAFWTRPSAHLFAAAEHHVAQLHDNNQQEAIEVDHGPPLFGFLDDGADDADAEVNADDANRDAAQTPSDGSAEGAGVESSNTSREGEGSGVGFWTRPSAHLFAAAEHHVAQLHDNNQQEAIEVDHGPPLFGFLDDGADDEVNADDAREASAIEVVADEEASDASREEASDAPDAGFWTRPSAHLFAAAEHHVAQLHTDDDDYCSDGGGDLHGIEHGPPLFGFMCDSDDAAEEGDGREGNDNAADDDDGARRPLYGRCDVSADDGALMISMMSSNDNNAVSTSSGGLFYGGDRRMIGDALSAVGRGEALEFELNTDGESAPRGGGGVAGMCAAEVSPASEAGVPDVTPPMLPQMLLPPAASISPTPSMRLLARSVTPTTSVATSAGGHYKANMIAHFHSLGWVVTDPTTGSVSVSPSATPQMTPQKGPCDLDVSMLAMSAQHFEDVVLDGTDSSKVLKAPPPSPRIPKAIYDESGGVVYARTDRIVAGSEADGTAQPSSSVRAAGGAMYSVVSYGRPSSPASLCVPGGGVSPRGCRIPASLADSHPLSLADPDSDDDVRSDDGDAHGGRAASIGGDTVIVGVSRSFVAVDKASGALGVLRFYSPHAFGASLSYAQWELVVRTARRFCTQQQQQHHNSGDVRSASTMPSSAAMAAHPNVCAIDALGTVASGSNALPWRAHSAWDYSPAADGLMLWVLSKKLSATTVRGMIGRGSAVAMPKPSSIAAATSLAKKGASPAAGVVSSASSSFRVVSGAPHHSSAVPPPLPPPFPLPMIPAAAGSGIDGYGQGFGGNVPFAVARRILRDVLNALVHLHEEVGAVHGCLRPECLVMSDGSRCAVGDVGLSQIILAPYDSVPSSEVLGLLGGAEIPLPSARHSAYAFIARFTSHHCEGSAVRYFSPEACEATVGGRYRADDDKGRRGRVNSARPQASGVSADVVGGARSSSSKSNHNHQQYHTISADDFYGDAVVAGGGASSYWPNFNASRWPTSITAAAAGVNTTNSTTNNNTASSPNVADLSSSCQPLGSLLPITAADGSVMIGSGGLAQSSHSSVSAFARISPPQTQINVNGGGMVAVPSSPALSLRGSPSASSSPSPAAGGASSSSSSAASLLSVDLCPSTDIYSISLIFIEMVMGCHPFHALLAEADADAAPTTAAAEVGAKGREATTLPPSSSPLPLNSFEIPRRDIAVLRALSRRFPPSLREEVDRAMAALEEEEAEAEETARRRCLMPLQRNASEGGRLVDALLPSGFPLSSSSPLNVNSCSHQQHSQHQRPHNNATCDEGNAELNAVEEEEAEDDEPRLPMLPGTAEDYHRFNITTPSVSAASYFPAALSNRSHSHISLSGGASSRGAALAFVHDVAFMGLQPDFARRFTAREMLKVLFGGAS